MKRRMNLFTGLAPLLLTATVGLLVASCSQDAEQAGAVPADATTLSLSALYTAGSGSSDGGSSDGDSTTPAVATRASGTTYFSTTGSIGFFVNADATHGYPAISNCKGTYSNERSLWLPATDIWLNHYPADIAVYAPYDAAQTTAGKLILTPCLRLDDSKDLWCKRLSANSYTYLEDPTVLTPALEHIYTRLSVTIVKNVNYAATAALSSLTVSGGNICAGSTYNPFAATDADAYDRTTAGTGITVAPDAPLALTTDAATTAAKLDLLLIPATLTEDVTLAVIIDGAAGSNADMYIPLSKTLFTESKLAAGKHYTVNLTLDPRGLTLGSIKTTDWDEQPEFGGGDLEYPVEIKSVQIGTYFWAIANLRTSDAGMSNFEFEKKPWISGVYPGEKLNGEVEAKKTNLCYWNWGCLNTPYNTPYLTGENAKWGDIEDETHGDPCAKVAPAGTWQVPSTEQFNDLTNHLPAKGSSVSINGEVFEVINESGWAENKALDVAGQVFVENDKAIFLPAAGGRNPDGSVSGSGSFGFYWIRTPNSTHGDYLNFKSSDCYVSHNARDYGYSVRCVIKNPTGRAGRP